MAALLPPRLHWRGFRAQSGNISHLMLRIKWKWSLGFAADMWILSFNPSPSSWSEWSKTGSAWEVSVEFQSIFFCFAKCKAPIPGLLHKCRIKSQKKKNQRKRWFVIILLGKNPFLLGKNQPKYLQMKNNVLQSCSDFYWRSFTYFVNLN